MTSMRCTVRQKYVLPHVEGVPPLTGALLLARWYHESGEDTAADSSVLSRQREGCGAYRGARGTRFICHRGV